MNIEVSAKINQNSFTINNNNLIEKNITKKIFAL